VLPRVFERYGEAAARAADLKKGTDALFTADNLNGLPPVFAQLGLLRDEKGKPVFRADSGALREVMDRIEERANYGDTASGRYLADELAKEPFGWDFEAVRLFALALVRAGKVEVTAKGQTYDVLTGTEAKEALGNNTTFRQGAFRPKKGIEFEELVRAAEAFHKTFGAEVRELNAGAIAAELRRAVARHEDAVSAALTVLNQHRLPGAGMLEDAQNQMRAIMRGSEDSALSVFNAGHSKIQDAIKRAADLGHALTEPRLVDIARARRALSHAWAFLRTEPEVKDDLRDRAKQLDDLLSGELFFRELAAIDQHAKAIDDEYQRRYGAALAARVTAYADAHATLVATAGWTDLDETVQGRIAEPFVRLKDGSRDAQTPIPQLRSERDAAEGRLRAAVAEVRRLLEGERLVTVSLASFFGAGVETTDQLDAALDGIREECTRLIGAGKKVVIQ
jgi:hypothetical protein